MVCVDRPRGGVAVTINPGTRREQDTQRLATDPSDIPSAPLPELTPAQLRRHCEPSHFEFTDTTQIGPTGKLAGQDRARASLDFGLGIAGQGFNIYAMGPAG